MAVIIKTTEAFEAAHRQFGDPGKCGGLHGHNWVVEFCLCGEVKSHLGYLVDFKDLKEAIRKYDHTTMLLSTDPLCEVLEGYGKVCRLPLNPTCESLATIILGDILGMVDKGTMDFITITVWENPESMATDQWTRTEVTDVTGERDICQCPG